MMHRRDLLKTGLAAVATGALPFPLAWTAPADAPKKRILMFTRSAGYEHSVIKRTKEGKMSLAENIVLDLGKKHGFEVTCTKDGREFLPQTIAKYDAFLFETTGDLTKEGSDNQPPMPPEGKTAFLKAIADGKGFVGCHCATDTFHSKGDSFQNQAPDQRDPYIRMIGGEFIKHGAQQEARMRVIDPKFPGAPQTKDFTLKEEWYSLKNFAPDLHVILVQETEGMKGFEYERPDFPATWARKDGKGRVFYTSMGHREDVWENPIFQTLLVGALNWAVHNVDANIPPNIQEVTAKAGVMPVKPAKK